MAASALSSLEAMLYSLTGRSRGGGDDALGDSPPLSALPARPTLRGLHRRRASWPPPSVAVVGAAGPWTTMQPRPQSASPPKEEDAGEKVAALVEELERKATMAEAQLRQKEEENAALRRRIESYHVRWLQYEIKLKSLEETFHEQMASLQMARESAERSREMMPHDRHESSESHMKMSEETAARLRHGCGRVGAVRRRSATARPPAGAEFRRQRQPFESGAAAEAAALVGARPWQPGGSPAGGNSIDDLKKLKSQFRAWKKDYKARLRKARLEVDWDRRRPSSCWI